MDKLLHQLLSVRTKSGHCELMIEFIKSIHPEAVEDKKGNLYITKGTGPYPCAVAHMDTVHDFKAHIYPIEINGIITGMDPTTMRQTGIGGDDKCGIYACLCLLHWLPSIKVAFFVDEEIGCMGSREADMEFFKDCKFVLMADRRDNCDFVNDIQGPLSSKAFQRAVEPLMKKRKFKFCTGMFTDVMALRDKKVGVSCANMSAGYYRPHSEGEYIIIDDMMNTIYLMYEICTTLTKAYPFIYHKKEWKWEGNGKTTQTNQEYWKHFYKQRYGHDDGEWEEDDHGRWIYKKKETEGKDRLSSLENWVPAKDAVVVDEGKAGQFHEWFKGEVQREEEPLEASSYDVK